jgi:hypothetical protein
MRKNGKIPPHFLYFLENEGIEITHFRSSNFAGKDSYDRVIVKFPYSYKTLDMQVIFDNLDYSTPPDFLFVKETLTNNNININIDYEEIIKDWNFKESSTLYNSLNKIKEKYSIHQEKKFKEEIKNSSLNSNNNINEEMENFNLISNRNDSETMSIFEHIDKIITKIKSKFINYKQIPRSSTFLDLVLNYGVHNFNTNNNLYGQNLNKNKTFEKVKENNLRFDNHIIISYPVDFLIRSRNLNRSPVINIYIPITYDMRFYMDITTPHFVSFHDFKISNDFFDLRNFNEVMIKFENQLFDYLREMQLRENLITKIIEANIGFPLEVDTYNYSKFSLYFNYPGNKSNLNPSSTSSFKNTSIGTTVTNKERETPYGGKITPFKTFTPSPMQNLQIPISDNPSVQLLNTNFILFFSFAKDDKKLEFQIINCDMLRMIVKKRFDYLNSGSEREINNLLSIVLQTILENIQKKK